MRHSCGVGGGCGFGRTEKPPGGQIKKMVPQQAPIPPNPAHRAQGQQEPSECDHLQHPRVLSLRNSGAGVVDTTPLDRQSVTFPQPSTAVPPSNQVEEVLGSRAPSMPTLVELGQEPDLGASLQVALSALESSIPQPSPWLYGEVNGMFGNTWEPQYSPTDETMPAVEGFTTYATYPEVGAPGTSTGFVYPHPHNQALAGAVADVQLVPFAGPSVAPPPTDGHHPRASTPTPHAEPPALDVFIPDLGDAVPMEFEDGAHLENQGPEGDGFQPNVAGPENPALPPDPMNGAAYLVLEGVTRGDPVCHQNMEPAVGDPGEAVAVGGPGAQGRVANEDVHNDVEIVGPPMVPRPVQPVRPIDRPIPAQRNEPDDDTLPLEDASELFAMSPVEAISQSIRLEGPFQHATRRTEVAGNLLWSEIRLTPVPRDVEEFLADLLRMLVDGRFGHHATLFALKKFCQGLAKRDLFKALRLYCLFLASRFRTLNFDQRNLSIIRGYLHRGIRDLEVVMDDADRKHFLDLVRLRAD
jgi:hypothetical protein